MSSKIESDASGRVPRYARHDQGNNHYVIDVNDGASRDSLNPSQSYGKCVQSHVTDLLTRALIYGALPLSINNWTFVFCFDKVQSNSGWTLSNGFHGSNAHFSRYINQTA